MPKLGRNTIADRAFGSIARSSPLSPGQCLEQQRFKNFPFFISQAAEVAQLWAFERQVLKPEL